MEAIAPRWSAAEWDNVGLLVGSPDWPLRRLLLAIDLTPDVLEEAVRGRFDAVLAYHPPIFRATKRMIADSRRQEGLAAAALAERIAVYSPHTALDAAPGGTNDTLASLCGLEETEPVESLSPSRDEYKLVTFVPPAQLEAVAEAMFAAGAGRIGDYERCSYRLNGQGTFFGTASTSPAVGRRGRLETVNETRIEVVVPPAALAEVVAALRRAHPYEEPAFDVYPLRAPPEAARGQGRVGRWPQPVAVGRLARMLARKTGAANVSIVGNAGARAVRGLVCVGAAGSLPFEITGRPLGPGDVVITGEIRHHDALAYERCGAAAIALGHWTSERPVLTPLASRLRRMLRGVSVTVSRRDRDPFRST